MAWIQNLVLKDGQKRYRVWWKDLTGNSHAKRFPRYEDARSFARKIEADKERKAYLDPARGKLTVAEA